MFHLSLRRKIFISYFVVFFVFIVLMFPFSTRTVKRIIIKSLDDRTSELITKLQSAPDNEALVEYLKVEKPLIFFRVSVMTNELKVLYDTHTKRVIGPSFSQEYIIHHPEVLQAMEEGTGYSEDYSNLLGQRFAYFAKKFDFHGKNYVVRAAFPYKYISELSYDFKMGFFVLATSVLLLFSCMTWFIMHRLTSPIDQIIKAIKPYQEGRQTNIPKLMTMKPDPNDDMGQLAITLNSLSDKIQSHIDTLTQERNEKSTILESLVEGVVAVDQNMRVTYANHMALKLLSNNKETFVGKPFNVVHLPICEELLVKCQEDRIPLTASLQVKINGVKVFLDLIGVPSKDHSGAILVLQDKSTHYKMMEMRKDFVANASHELKTPITIIRGFAETLHDNPELPTETRQEITDKIVRNCKRLTNVIKDLLILSDIENIPPSRIIECDLTALANDCREMLLEIFPQATVLVEKDDEEDCIVSADPDLIELALFNLMENAAKYSNPPAHITVKLSKLDEQVKLSVADKGIGIPDGDLEHVFQRFYTVNKAHSQKMGGSGLGLSIVETIIEKHKGKISVTSTLGVGTTFTILLPTKS